MTKLAGCLLGVLAILPGGALSAESPNYAQKLGYQATDRVVLFHVDDVGMSHSSNQGAIEALEKGLATSLSLMMPCPWIPAIARYLRDNPEVDAGLHLTLTSEWSDYRWGPLAGKMMVPGLVDPEGALWASVAEVVQHASADEVEMEIRAQIERAQKLGIRITHLDSHMGTLFASPEFFERYAKVGIETGIPIMVAGGHLTHATAENGPIVEALRLAADSVWKAGLPVLDDVHTGSYGWSPQEKKQRFIELLRNLRPGVTQILIHASRPTSVFPAITDSSESRLADLEAMLDPDLARVIKEEGILLTTWTELMKRRQSAAH